MTDYGALATRDPKGRVSLPAGLMVEDRPDPDAPNRTVRGVKRDDPLVRLFGANRKAWSDVDRLRYWAAELYREDVAISDGARPDRPASWEERIDHASASYGPAKYQIDGETRRREAYAIVPSKARPVFDWVVVRCAPLVKMQGHSGRSHAALRSSLMAGLDALAVHYEGCGR